MNRYRFERWQNLIVVRAAAESEEDIKVARLMVDTGAAQTMLSWQKLQDVGIDPASSRERRQVLTVGSMVTVPQVRLRRLHCLGKVMENLPVLCHTLPFVTDIDGLLGMDFLRAFNIEIHVRRGYIEVE